MALNNMQNVIDKVRTHPEWVQDIEFSKKGSVVMFVLSPSEKKQLILYIDSRDGHAGGEFPNPHNDEYRHFDFFDPNRNLTLEERNLSEQLFIMITNIANSR